MTTCGLRCVTRVAAEQDKKHCITTLEGRRLMPVMCGWVDAFMPSVTAVAVCAAPAGGSGSSSSSPLRRDAAGVSNRWAGRFASSGGQAPQESPTREQLLPASEQRS